MKQRLITILGMTLLGTTTLLVSTGSAHAHYIQPLKTQCGLIHMTYHEPKFVW